MIESITLRIKQLRVEAERDKEFKDPDGELCEASLETFKIWVALVDPKIQEQLKISLTFSNEICVVYQCGHKKYVLAFHPVANHVTMKTVEGDEYKRC